MYALCGRISNYLICGHYDIYNTPAVLIVGYDIHYYLLNMLFVVRLVILSNLCGGGGGCTDMFLESLHIYITNVHIPDPILIVHMLSIAGRLATLK